MRVVTGQGWGAIISASRVLRRTPSFVWYARLAGWEAEAAGGASPVLPPAFLLAKAILQVGLTNNYIELVQYDNMTNKKNQADSAMVREGDVFGPDAKGRRLRSQCSQGGEGGDFLIVLRRESDGREKLAPRAHA